MEAGRIFVTDFDGTMTRHDFFVLALEQLVPRDIPDYWGRYRAGQITHFQALQAIFRTIRGDEADLLRVVHAMQLDPGLPQAVAALREAGWRIVVASAGCGWYIERLLDEAGVEVEVHANPGRFVPHEGLQMELPAGSGYVSPQLGVDKARIVRDAVDSGATVAFAGDGYPDVEAARLVPQRLRFARGALAESLAAEGLGYRPYAAWSQIAGELLEAVR